MQEVDGGVTLDEWYAGRADVNLGVGVDGYFATLGGKLLNSRVWISRLGLGSLQEVVFHGRLKGGASKGAGRVDSPNLGEWHCWQNKDGLLQVWHPQVWGLWWVRW